MDTGLFHGSAMGSPGFDELRWLKPVRPGDTLSVELEVVDMKPSASKPDRGIIRFAYRIMNQRQEVVLTMLAMHLLKRHSVAHAP